MNYKEKYIKSKGLKKGEFIECENCGGEATQVHHLIFRSHIFGKKRDEPSNLIALCFNCHDRAHNSRQFNSYLKSLK